MNKLKIFLLLSYLLINNCSSPLSLSRSEDVKIGRSPDIINIDAGNVVPESQIAFSILYSNGINDPQNNIRFDTFATSRDILAMHTFRKTEFLENRHAINVEALYGIKNELAAGFSVDAAFGNKQITPELIV